MEMRCRWGVNRAGLTEHESQTKGAHIPIFHIQTLHLFEVFGVTGYKDEPVTDRRCNDP